MEELYKGIALREYGCALMLQRRALLCENDEISSLLVQLAYQERVHSDRWAKVAKIKPLSLTFEQEAIDGIKSFRSNDWVEPTQRRQRSPEVSDRLDWARWFFKGKAIDLPLSQLVFALAVGEKAVGFAYLMLSCFLSGEASILSREIGKEEFFQGGEVSKLTKKIEANPLKRFTALSVWSARIVIAIFLMIRGWLTGKQ